MKFTKPRYVVIKNGSMRIGVPAVYLGKNDIWTTYDNSKRFKTAEEASEASERVGGDHGVFPCSNPRRIK